MSDKKRPHTDDDHKTKPLSQEEMDKQQESREQPDPDEGEEEAGSIDGGPTADEQDEDHPVT